MSEKSLIDCSELVFMPGLDGTGISFEPLSRFVSPGARVTVVRYPPGKLSFDRVVECAGAQVAPAANALVVAESFSGPVAVELIATGRLRACCLALCATFARSPRPFLLGLALRSPLALILRLPLPDAVMKRALGSSGSDASLLELGRRVRAMVPPGVLAQRLRVVSGVDVRPRLADIASLPAIYLQAAEDLLVPGRALEDFRAALPRLRVERLPGPHFLLQAKPRESAAAIGDFIRRVGCAQD